MVSHPLDLENLFTLDDSHVNYWRPLRSIFMVNGISEKRRFVETASERRLVEMLIVRAPAQAFYVQPASAENQEVWHFRQKSFGLARKESISTLPQLSRAPAAHWPHLHRLASNIAH
jgi:hypothetical protein